MCIELSRTAAREQNLTPGCKVFSTIQQNNVLEAHNVACQISSQ